MTHVIRARIDGEIVVVDERSSYEEALSTWQRLVELIQPATGKPRQPVLLANQRDNAGTTNARPCRVAWLDVRDAADPSTRVPRVKLAVLRPGRGSQDADAPVRRWAEAHGFHGHTGGWKYRGVPYSDPRHDDLCSYPNHVAQGWWSFARNRILPGVIVYVEGRYHLTEEIR